MRDRGISYTNGDLLSEYGDGKWPLLAAYNRGDVAENGNLLEPSGIAVRHGVCGDPKQVRTKRPKIVIDRPLIIGWWIRITAYRSNCCVVLLLKSWLWLAMQGSRLLLVPPPPPSFEISKRLHIATAVAITHT